MLFSSYIEISKSAYQNNLAFIRRQLGNQVKFSSVIKGNAYGHGIEEFAPMAQSCGVNHFSVFSSDEAARLLKILPAPASILIMGFIDVPELEWAIENNIEFYVFEASRLAEAAKAARRVGKPALIHLELETGMNRTGFYGSELLEAQKLLIENTAYLNLQGLCTHFAGSEASTNHERVTKQIEVYSDIREELEIQGLKASSAHVACSAAMLAYPQTKLDMVRVGILQYGFWPSQELFHNYLSANNTNTDPLKRLINWKSSIMSIKHVAKGDYIGYGTSFEAPIDMVIAAVPVGYAWGYSRMLSNQGEVLVHGKRARVVGIVNMNAMMIDVTHIPQVRVQDEVVLLGKQGEESITVASFSELSTQLNYEMLTRLPLNIPRRVVD